MHFSRLIRSAAPALIAVLAACNEPASAPSRTEPALLASEAAGGAIVGVANGGGVIDVTSPPPAVGEAEFRFSAVQHADGSANGHFRMIRQRAGFTVDFEGDVVCVSFDPVNHRAWIGGVVRRNRSDDPNHSLAIHQPGRDVWFRVQDNGDNAAAEPDRSSVYGFEGAGGVITSPEYCQRQLWTAGNVNAFEVIQGQVQVHTP